ncbi:MAG: NADH-quinone oxidoreductase subunit L [Chloroflexi bacterium]|jgi:NADH:ubiquinone oxidoreductase subunit 6 (subunit J)|nr:NADH-quinone oxidoreductase subunit L [Chloroflexota bacterium]
MGADIAFWIFAVIAVIAALGVVAQRNLFRAALLLVLSFFAVAGIYGSLSADFMAVAQVLVYMGAISVLIIFGVMLTKDVQRGNSFNRAWPSALVVCAALMGLLVFVFIDTDWNTDMVQTGATIAEDKPTTSAIADAIFDKDAGFLLPLEIGAALILAAVIGAIALVKDK